MKEAAPMAGPAGIDGGLYIDVTSFARETRWLNGAMNAYTTFGLVLLGVMLGAAWWIEWRGDRTATIRLVTILAGMGCAVVANVGLKALVQERRPCLSMHHGYTVVACPAPTDYAFPSNHAAFAGALAVGVLLFDRRLGVLALALALLEGFSRVYLGIHYPRDAVVGLLLGAAVTALAVRLLSPLTAALASRSRRA
jgi:undecaprenyl-diphosphatase